MEVLSRSPILMNHFRRQWTDIGDDVLAAVAEVGAGGWYVLGEKVAAFEGALARDWPLPYAVGVASGMDAIEIALRAAGLRPGDKVLTTPLSAFASTLAILRVGGVPVFADVEASGLMDFDEARAACQTFPEMRFILPVHLYGFPLDAARLKELVAAFRLTCVEDCAQSIGATLHGISTGLAGVAAATSFYPTKNLGALGDGGAILTADADLADRARRLRDYGQSAKYRHSELGWNSRLDELQAAILLHSQLPRLRRWIERRRQIAAAYTNNWPSRSVALLPSPAGDPCWHLFPVRVTEPDRKQSLIAFLREAHIGTGEHYPVLIPDQEAMRDQTHICFGDLPQARALAASQLSLPIHPYLEDDEVDNVLTAIERWPG